MAGRLLLLDQTLLPAHHRHVECRGPGDVVHAIQRLAVRGAPAIGIAAAYGVVLGLRGAEDPRAALEETCALLAAARPTAVNLRWAVERVRTAALHAPPGAEAVRALEEALAIHREDTGLCGRIGRAGADLVPEGGTVLTHCNTGILATGGTGTALAVLYEAWRRGTRFQVLAGETRPLLQGARLTALELLEAGIPVKVLVDGAAASLMARGLVDLVLVGADRVTASGDVANKVGTYPLALAAHAHGIPFYVAAPSSTFDLSLPDGASVPIEERDPAEVLGTSAPAGVGALNPAFDVTPARLLTGLITERGIVRPVDAGRLGALLAGGGPGL